VATQDNFSVSATLDGHGLTARQLRACARNLPFEVHLAMRKTLALLEKYAVLAAPHETGEFRRSIHSAMYSGTSGEVGTNHAAGGALDEGARPHIIRPRNAKYLAIPFKDASGGYTSRSKRGKKGQAKTFKKVQYKDVSSAPNKRHLDVDAVFTKGVHHPGMKGFMWLTKTTTLARRLVPREAHSAVDRAIRRAGGSKWPH